MGGNESTKWFNDGANIKESTIAPVIGTYKVYDTYTPKTRGQKRILALNTELRNLAT